MYNLILVDDEILTLNMLKNYVCWSDYGFSLAGCFSSGVSALEYVKNNPVHAIITDICIPDMDGIELVQSCKKFAPDIAIGFISSHRNFDYAYAVSNMNSCGYILKPIIKKEFLELCQKLSERIKSTRTGNRLENYNNLKFENLQTQLKCQEILSDIMCGNLVGAEEIDRKFLSEGIDISNEEPSCIIEIALPDFREYMKNTWKHDSVLLYNSIGTLVSYNNGSIRTLPLAWFENKILVIAFSKKGNEEIFEKKLTQVVEIIKENLISILKLSQIEIDATRFFNKLSELADFALFEQEESFAQDNSLISDALDYIHDNYADINSINSVADYVHFSPVYFGRYFAKKMNKSFKTYLNELKIEKAKELLKNSDIKTTAIAAMLGFNNESYFYTVFKDITKLTPTQYRKKHMPDAE